MKKYITLNNVIDIRTGQLHSVAIVEEHDLRYFKPMLEVNE